MTGAWNWWLGRCLERPWRAFLQLWLLLVLLFLLAGFVGFRWETFSDDPPVPEMIDYAFAIGQRGLYGNIELELDPDDIPTFDPTLQPKGVAGVVPLIPHPDTGEPWLIWQRRTRDISFGWPFAIVDVFSHTSWDVTNPRQPFPLAGGYWSDSSAFDLGSSLDPTLTRVGSDGAHMTTLEFHAGEFFSVVLPLEIGCALLTWMSWFTVHRRRKLRLRKGACLACGHLLGPAPRPRRCPECGVKVIAGPIATRRRSRFGWMFVAMLVVLLVSWLVAGFTFVDEYPQKPLAEQMEYVARAGENATAQNRMQWGAVTHFAGAYGFPLYFIDVSRRQWFLAPPNQTPYPGLPAWMSVGLSYDAMSEEVTWSRHSGSGFVTSISVPWKLAVALVGAVEILAFAFAVFAVMVTCAVRFVWRRATR